MEPRALSRGGRNGDTSMTEPTGGPKLVDGKIYAGSEEGDVFVLAAEPKFEILAKNKIGERLRASPAVADGRLYVRGTNHLYCFAKKN